MKYILRILKCGVIHKTDFSKCGACLYDSICFMHKYVNEKLGIPSRSRYMNRENRMLLFAYSSGHNYSNKFIS